MERKIWIYSYLVSQSRGVVNDWLFWIQQGCVPISHPTEIRANKDLKTTCTQSDVDATAKECTHSYDRIGLWS